MKQNISQSYLRKGNSYVMNGKGQVGIVVAILLVTIMVAVLITVQVYYLPQWMKEREAEHMDVVTNQFAGLKYSFDLQAMEQSSSPLTNSITLGSKELPYLVSSRSFGSLQILTSDISNFSISVSGTGMTSSSVTLQGIGVSNTSYVVFLDTFELLIDVFATGNTYRANLTDGISTGEILLTVSDFSTNMYQINLTVRYNDQTLLNQPIATGLKKGGDYRVNLLNEDYKISTTILSGFSTPFNISFDLSSSNGRFLLSCEKFSDVASISKQYDLGTIQYKADNAYFASQSYIYEAGSVILSQNNGNSLLYPLLLYTSNEPRTVTITIIDVVGVAGKTGVSGYGTYSIRANYSNSEPFLYQWDNLTINISTKYPSAWYTYLNNTFNESGIDYILTPASAEQLTSFVAISLKDVKLLFEKVTIYAQIGPGWIT